MKAEEVKDASQTVPRTLLWSFLPNASMFIIMGATFIFCVGDLDSVMSTPTGQPFIQVFFNATQSHAGTTIMVVIILIMLLAAAIGETATSSRQLWSFARDRVSVCAQESLSTTNKFFNRVCRSLLSSQR